jgi:hypothetical protein
MTMHSRSCSIVVITQPVAVTHSRRPKRFGWGMRGKGKRLSLASPLRGWVAPLHSASRQAAPISNWSKVSSPADIPFRENATEASLLAGLDGWHLVLISDRGRESVFASRNDIRDVILDENLGNESAVCDHFEERLRAAGYESARMTPQLGALAAWWLSPGLPSDL